MRGLHGWVRLLERNQTAVLAALIKQLDQITGSDESSISQLATAIMKDAGLTSNILRIANSVQFNQSGTAITTVSRAILNIGFKHIRSICLSLKVLETVLSENPSELLLASLAKSLHGATQARNLCTQMNQIRQEEVFVGSLLGSLVELLVLASSENDAKELSNHLELDALDEDKNRFAEKILGVSFTRLAKTLMKQWRIEGLVHQYLLAPEEPDPQVQAIMLGAEISRTSLHGWDSPDFQATLKKVAAYKEITPEQASKLVQASAEEAVEMVNLLGRGQMSRMISTRQKAATWSAKEKNGAADEKTLLQPDSSLQLKALQDLSAAMVGNFNVNQIFQMILEGLHQGIGLERVVFAIFNPNDQTFFCKHVRGEQGERLKEAFVLRYVKSQNGFLHNLFEKDAAVWLGPQRKEDMARYLDGSIKAVSGVDEFFIAPLLAKGKKVGLLYADMGVSKRALNQQQYQGFGMFLQQFKIALSVLASKSA